MPSKNYPIKTVLTSALVALLLAGCSGHSRIAAHSPSEKGVSATTIGPLPHGSPTLSILKHTLLSLLKREWEYFGKQVIYLNHDEESISHVGHWEDDGEPYVVRVNWYWRAVGKPQLNGNDCHQPWSAAFISWIMRESGVPESEFPSADAHRDYLLPIVEHASTNPQASFLPHSVTEYAPQPGDLICATRGGKPEALSDELDLHLILTEHTKLHCDMVVERHDNMLAVIGGNVRNSVSKTFLTLDQNGFVERTYRRPWFMILENRL